MPTSTQPNYEYCRPLTPAQLRTLKAIWYYYRKFRIAPTMDEIAKLLGKPSAPHVQRAVDALRKKGYLLQVEPRTFRGTIPVISVEDAERVIQQRPPPVDRYC